MNIGKNCVIYYGLEVRDPWNVVLGDGVIIGDHSMLDARCGIVVRDNVNLSTGVWIYTLQHDVNSESFSVAGEGGAVVVGDRAWLSTRTIVLPGCYITEGSVIAAGAVVTKTLGEPYSIWAGIPAHKIGNRNVNIQYIFNGKHRHFL